MSSWNPRVFLNKRLNGERQSIVAAFYTDVPTTIRTAPVSNADFKAAYSRDNWSSAPQRILIHSKEVMDELRQITEVPDTQKTGVLAMVPPFKYLLHHRNAIKSKLDELKHASSDDEDAPSTPENNINNKDLRIHRLQCIHDFIQTDLASYIGLELRGQDGDIEEVFFDEVYHLFKPGDILLSHLGSDNQLYQVASVMGGRMLLSSSSERSGNSRQQREAHTRAGTWTDLRIEFFTMAWDGENIGPRHSHIDIPYFTGRRWVTDLELYPIQFHKHGSEVAQRLLARGMKFIQCNGHKRYTGASVYPHNALLIFQEGRSVVIDGADNPGDDEIGKPSSFEIIQGDIYIDYKSYYTVFFSTSPNLGSMHTGVSEDAEAIDTLSNGKTWNCSDRDVDVLLSGRFLSKNRYVTKFGKPEKNLADDGARLQLLQGQVPAFVFSMRQWSELKTLCLRVGRLKLMLILSKNGWI